MSPSAGTILPQRNDASAEDVCLHGKVLQPMCAKQTGLLEGRGEASWRNPAGAQSIFPHLGWQRTSGPRSGPRSLDCGGIHVFFPGGF